MHVDSSSMPTLVGARMTSQSHEGQFQVCVDCHIDCRTENLRYTPNGVYCHKALDSSTSPSRVW